MYGILHSRVTLHDIESVQKYALRVCTKSWELILNITSIPPLHKRRLIACLSHLYKILNGLTLCFQMLLLNQRTLHTTADQLTQLTYVYQTFVPHPTSTHSLAKTITAWNNLPTDVRNCNSYKSFKSNVTKYLN